MTDGAIHSGIRCFAATLGVAVMSYGVSVGAKWFRYGRVRLGKPEDADPLLDRFISAYEVADKHHVRVAAPADITMAVAFELDLRRSAIIRAVFKGRELLLGSEPHRSVGSQPLLPTVTALGWRVLAELPGRAIVVGAVTQPWMADVVFRGVAPDEFRDFAEPGYVKIAWTLRADPITSTESLFHMETRATATDQAARARFRRYWAIFSPGIVLIRWVSLGLVKTEAERRARQGAAA